MSTDAAPVGVSVKLPDTVIVSMPVYEVVPSPIVSDVLAVPVPEGARGLMVGNCPLVGSVNVVVRLKVLGPKLGRVKGGIGFQEELDPTGGVRLGKNAESDPPRAPCPGDLST